MADSARWRSSGTRRSASPGQSGGDGTASDTGTGDRGRWGTRPDAAVAIAALVVVMWVIELIDTIVDHRLDRFGIRPRTVEGLRGVPVAPLLHAGFGHLAANTVPFVVLGVITAFSGAFRLAAVTTVVVVVSGAVVWVLGSSNEVHIGASGVVFGYLGYLGARAVFERRLVFILVAVAVGILFGGLIRGVVPGPQGISWQGHLGGLLGGILAARLLHARRAGRRTTSPSDA